ncbi:MAG: histidine kinase [Gudongella sp.]|nr:histidine kinase [Gudongella sp.]
MNIISNWRTEEKIIKLIHMVMLLLFLLLSAYTLILNTDRHLEMGLCFAAYLALSLFRHLFLSHMKVTALHFAFPYLELAVLYIANTLDSSGAILPMFIIVIWDIVLDYDKIYSISFSVVGYICYMIKYIRISSQIPTGTIIFVFIIAALQFGLFIGFAFLTKLYNSQSRDLENTTAELHARMLSTEHMTLLNERNRIAGEIHNTVGHQLTTALVQIEAAQMLMERNPEDASKRLRIIKSQVKDGLNELRKSIHAINADEDYKNFNQAVGRLIKQVKAHTNLSVSYESENIEHLSLSHKKILYHILLESITNAIRHGHCKQIRIRVSEIEGNVFLTCYNDGVVPKELKFGYGLTQISEKVDALRGSFKIKVNEDGWFGLKVELPIFSKEGEYYG